MINRLALFTIATLVGLGAFLAGGPQAARAQGIYFWAGPTSQGDSLELSVNPGPVGGSWTVTQVRLGGATVRCAKSSEELDLSGIVFPANALIKTSPAAPFTIGRLVTDDEQVALLLTSQIVTYNQIRGMLTVYWSHLHYSGAKDMVPVPERCSAVLPVTLHLLIAD
jgi:hypothetical protein